MLIRFRFENSRSFATEQELSMVAGNYPGEGGGPIELKGLTQKLLPVAGIFGANASGKSNVLKSLGFVRQAVRQSHREWDPAGKIPVAPFLFDRERAKQAMRFEVDFVLEGVRYEYGFAVDAEEFKEEWLRAYPNGKKQTLFTRDTSREPVFRFGSRLPGENRAVEALTRKNSLFLSAGAQNNHEFLLPIYEWFVQRVRISTPETFPTRVAAATSAIRQYPDELVAFLKAADLGVVGADVHEEELTAQEKKLFEMIRESMAPESPPSFKKDVVTLLHMCADRSEGIPLDLEDESFGTLALLALGGPVLGALASGGLLLVDELDASLHPKITAGLVKMFNDSERNSSNAQLVFTSHDTSLLKGDTLRRDEVWFVEKDSAGASHLYPLSDFKVRKEENLERRYLHGRFGAVPLLDAFRGQLAEPYRSDE